MTNDNFKMLCREIETLASQVFGGEPAPCQFEDEPETIECIPEFNSIWEDRS